MSKKTKPKYNTEYKEKAVRMVINSDKSTAQIAKGLGMKSTTLYSWINRTKLETVKESSKNHEAIFNELKRLKKELAEVKEQRDMLKKAINLDGLFCASKLRDVYFSSQV